MAAFRQFLYTNNGNEIEFMQGFVDLILNLGVDIKVEDASGNEITVADAYSDLTSATTATFYLNFGTGTTRMKFQRGNHNAAAIDHFWVSDPTETIRTRAYFGGDMYVGTSAARSFYVTYIKGENFFAFWLGDYNISSVSSSKLNFSRITNAGAKYFEFSTGINPLSNNYSGNNTSGRITSFLNYAAPAGQIDYIDSAPFISGGTKQFETSDVKQCSTIPQFSSIALPIGKNYFAISANAMIELDSESA